MRHPLSRFSAGWFLMLLLLGGALPASAQLQPYTRYKGTMLPVVYYDAGCYVMNKGKREEASVNDVEIRPGTGFAPGEVIITAEHSDLDLLKNAPLSKRVDPQSMKFRYEAEVSSSIPLKECYGVLTIVANGSVGTHFFNIGSLSPGKTRRVKVELPRRVDAVGHLHVFSSGLEVRSAQMPGPYDAKEYFAALVRGSRGISAVALCKTEDEFPHELSDNGDLLATVRERDTHHSLIIYDLKTSAVLHDIKLGDRGETAWDPKWISDHELVYVSQDNQNDYPTYLMLLDIRTGKTERLERNVINIVTSVKRQRDTLVVFGSRWQYRTGSAIYRVRERKLGSINPIEVGTTYFDDLGEQRLRYEPNGTTRRLLYRLSSKTAWRAMDDDVKEPGLKFDFDSRNALDRICQIHSLGKDGDTIYISTRQKSDRFALASFSLSKGVVNQVFASHPKYDLADGSENAGSRLLFRKGSSELIGLTYEGEKPQVVWLDAGYAAVQKAMDQAFPNHFNRPVDWSVDGSTFIYHSYSDQDPGTFYLFRPFESQLSPLLSLGDALKDQTLARTVPFDFTARDGGTVHAYLTSPPEIKAGQRSPLVVVIHGGPTVRDVWKFDATNQFLATRGYLVLQVNFRGSSGYGAAYQKAGLYSRFDTVVLDDIADGVKTLIKNHEVDPDRIAVMGGSFGGWAAYMSLIKYPELYRTGVAIAAVSHWRALIRDTGAQYDGDYAASYWKNLLERSDFAKAEPFIDPYLRAGEIKQPIYIMHGSRDRVVQPTEAKMMIDALKKTNPGVESISFPAATHTYWPYATRVTMLNEIEGFLRRTIPPSDDKAAAVAAETAAVH